MNLQYLGNYMEIKSYLNILSCLPLIAEVTSFCVPSSGSLFSTDMSDSIWKTPDRYELTFLFVWRFRTNQKLHP